MIAKYQNGVIHKKKKNQKTTLHWKLSFESHSEKNLNNYCIVKRNFFYSKKIAYFLVLCFFLDIIFFGVLDFF